MLDEANLEALYNMILGYGLKVLGAIVVIIVGWIASKWARRIVIKAFERRPGSDATLAKFFSNLVAWLVIVIAFIAALEMFGVQTTSFVALLGAAGLAIGLAFQGTLSNFAAGVMLLVFRPFKVGDAIKVAGELGVVEEVGLFVTNLDTPDNRRIVIPNSNIFGSVIETLTFHPTRRVDVPVGTEYPADIDAVRAILQKAANAVEGRLDDRAPEIFLQDLGASSIDWVVRVWAPTADYWTVRQATIRDVKKSLDDAGIGIPFPQMDVHLDGLPTGASGD
ncbi:MAG: mechanosensitive ion channel [Rhodothermales bacterium]|nr:mechanosensitive ion channel [Rhodothermales bacterium]